MQVLTKVVIITLLIAFVMIYLAVGCSPEIRVISNYFGESDYVPSTRSLRGDGGTPALNASASSERRQPDLPGPAPQTYGKATASTRSREQDDFPSSIRKAKLLTHSSKVIMRSPQPPLSQP